MKKLSVKENVWISIQIVDRVIHDPEKNVDYEISSVMFCHACHDEWNRLRRCTHEGNCHMQTASSIARFRYQIKPLPIFCTRAHLTMDESSWRWVTTSQIVTRLVVQACVMGQTLKVGSTTFHITTCQPFSQLSQILASLFPKLFRYQGRWDGTRFIQNSQITFP